ncbi:hypothetical protein IP70_16460 [alpha proteobacterium AAP38]|nr:hypothetical protein IP70_16460 [alpha proteobacterium AAP38]
MKLIGKLDGGDQIQNPLSLPLLVGQPVQNRFCLAQSGGCFDNMNSLLMVFVRMILLFVIQNSNVKKITQGKIQLLNSLIDFLFLAVLFLIYIGRCHFFLWHKILHFYFY